MTDAPIILLAPSEEKAPGGAQGHLAETAAQRWVRERLVALAKKNDPEALWKAFDVKELALAKARTEALALAGAVPVLPALARYTGVAFQALDAATLPAETWAQVFILSNLRGLVRGDELLPPYKLKAGAIPGLRAHWRKALPAQVATIPAGPLWELLPGEVADLLKGWARPRHTVEIFDARGKAISHFSKKYRGLVARWILTHRQGDPRKVLKGRIPGCQWTGMDENDRGGLALRLVVES
ncbi:peroxide stress protein YaaA [Geothrix sp.]|jgi:cytoplasmic iron level regulating protein YaaA (DUF328/UPF0246 family)|uniref:peroxide stress protein YaaA n=1 Tax=Geothrix sp. TaxID=1962974 RepID=UPI0025BDA023|nr:peroxide stress protein YaaA [Geothrix sp.]